MLNVIAGVIYKKDKILIARRAQHKHLGGYWEFPGGKIEGNESPESCLKREIFEELKICIEINSFFMETVHHYENISIILKVYICTYVSGETSLIDHDKVCWVTNEQLNSYSFALADIPIIDKLIQVSNK